MDKFFVWFGNHRKSIGYTLAVLNLLVAIMHLFHGEYGLAMLWTVIGLYLGYDAYDDNIVK